MPKSSPPTPTDEDLIAAHLAQDPSAFTTLYDRYLNPIYSYLRLRTSTPQTAEDLTSQTFLQALQSAHRFKPSRGSFRSWLYTIARNLLIDHYRTHHPTAELTPDLELLSDPEFNQKFDQRITKKILLSALSVLSPSQREIIFLRIWHDLSYKEISALTSRSVPSLKMTFSRALKTLRTTLPPETFLTLLITLLYD